MLIRPVEITVTCASEEEAALIMGRAIELRLVACGQTCRSAAATDATARSSSTMSICWS